MALQVMLSQLDWPWPAKFAMILLVALPVMLASDQLLERHTLMGVVLNGRRVRREQQSMPIATEPAIT